MAAPATRWGIAGAGKISRQFVRVLLTQDPKEQQVAAVGARSLERAQEFTKEFGIPKAYGSYDGLAQDPDIDVVYVGAVHYTHYDICKQMLEAGKNVLCEKPFMMNQRQTESIVKLAKEKNVFLMEGFWSRFFPMYDQLREELAKKTIGDIKLVTVNLGFDIPPRTQEGDGVLMWLGCYPIQFAQLIYGGEQPKKISAHGIIRPDGTDLCETITLEYSDNKMAVLNNHCGLNLNTTATMFGSKGQMEVPFFYNPETLITPEKTYECKLSMDSPYRGFVYEQQAVRNYILQGVKESPLMSLSDSIQIMGIMDQVRKELGMVFSVDKE